jgi:hypothetical protein
MKGLNGDGNLFGNDASNRFLQKDFIGFQCLLVDTHLFGGIE